MAHAARHIASLSRRLLSTTAAATAAATAVAAVPPTAATRLMPPVCVHASDVRANLVGLVGNTPLLTLASVTSAKTLAAIGLSAAVGKVGTVVAKAEWMNPGGSVKDRAAVALVAAAEAAGKLRPGGTVVEGTAGNTGIGLAHVCNARGYKLVIYMPNTQSQEKIDLLRLLGADVRPVPAVAITDPAHYTFQARNYAATLPNAVWTNQFDNTANRQAHFESTGPELWAQTGGALDGFTCATGTGGTLAGTGAFLKAASAGRVAVYLADPPGSVLHSWVTSGGAKLERSGSSITEGIGQGRVTDNLAGSQLDGSFQVDDRRSIAMLFRLLKDEGVFVGASSALNVVAAVELAAKLGPTARVATVLADGAHRYQTRLFSKAWLASKGLLDAVPEDCRHLVPLA